MPPTMPETSGMCRPEGLRPVSDKDFVFQVLREIDDYPEKVQISVNVSSLAKEAIRKLAEAQGSKKFTMTHLVDWALIRFARERGLIT